ATSTPAPSSLSLPDALPISHRCGDHHRRTIHRRPDSASDPRASDVLVAAPESTVRFRRRDEPGRDPAPLRAPIDDGANRSPGEGAGPPVHPAAAVAAEELVADHAHRRRGGRKRGRRRAHAVPGGDPGGGYPTPGPHPPR